jgi:hypothetical protein
MFKDGLRSSHKLNHFLMKNMTPNQLSAQLKREAVCSRPGSLRDLPPQGDRFELPSFANNNRYRNHFLALSFFRGLPQPDARPFPIPLDEDHASRFEGGDDLGRCVRAAAQLTVP